MTARRYRTQEVAGSSPASSIAQRHGYAASGAARHDTIRFGGVECVDEVA